MEEVRENGEENGLRIGREKRRGRIGFVEVYWLPFDRLYILFQLSYSEYSLLLRPPTHFTFSTLSKRSPRFLIYPNPMKPFLSFMLSKFIRMLIDQIFS